MTKPSASTALWGKESQRCCFTDKGGKEGKYTFNSTKHFSPGASPLVVARTSFVNRAPAEFGWPKTVQGKYPRWGTARKSKIETGGFDPYLFFSTPVMKLRVTNFCLGKNNVVQCNRVMGVCGLICRALNVLNLHQIFMESYEKNWKGPSRSFNYNVFLLRGHLPLD